MAAKKKIKSLVPKLRFPEFRRDQKWSSHKLSLLAKPIKEKATKLNSEDVLTLSGEYGLVRQTEYFGKKIAGSDLKRYLRIEQNDFVYNDRTTSSAKYGSLKRLSKYPLGAVSPIYKCFRFSREDNPVFWEHYFDAGAHEDELSEFVNEGARAGRFNISVDTFLSILVCYPTGTEQKKIADCFDSLDGLIAAHSAKLDALQDHKKGLLQKLFPAEGQTTPTLRFPEFEKEGEWKESTFSEFVQKSFYGTSKSTSATGIYPVIRMGNMTGGRVEFSNLVYIDLDKNEFQKISLKKGDILLNRTNSAELVGKISIFERGDEFITASYIVTFRLKKGKIDPQFCNYLLNTPENQYNIRAFSTRSISQCNINPSAFKKELNIRVPLVPEQQKIVACLKALDALTTTHTDQLADLKEHKKGLMQQLFPNPDLSKS